jgi:hypothetical protein
MNLVRSKHLMHFVTRTSELIVIALNALSGRCCPSTETPIYTNCPEITPAHWSKQVPMTYKLHDGFWHNKAFCMPLKIGLLEAITYFGWVFSTNTV